MSISTSPSTPIRWSWWPGASLKPSIFRTYPAQISRPQLLWNTISTATEHVGSFPSKISPACCAQLLSSWKARVANIVPFDTKNTLFMRTCESRTCNRFTTCLHISEKLQLEPLTGMCSSIADSFSSTTQRTFGRTSANIFLISEESSVVFRHVSTDYGN